MKKILCLTDFSENASDGILYANELAKKFSASLILFHTYSICDTEANKMLFHPCQIKYTDTECRENLYHICLNLTKENKYSGVDYGFITREGELQKNLNEIITDRKIDLVVLSMEGELNPTDPYYGNIVSEIVQQSNCPVILVPKGYRYQHIKNIVYAYDIEHESTLEKEATDFAKAMKAHLDILSYCNEEDEEYIEKIYSKYNLLKIRSGYDQMNLDIKATDNIISSLSQFITDRNADLLILENHKRILYKQLSEPSFTKSFVFFSKIPVMVIRSKEL